MLLGLITKLSALKSSTHFAFSTQQPSSFQSLSPLIRLNSRLFLPERADHRSLSCSDNKNVSKPIIPSKSRSRSLCFSEEYYSKSRELKNASEKQWEIEEEEKPRSESISFESRDQYELEAAKPRPKPTKQEVMQANEKRRSLVDRYVHLQPSQIKPYGSSENFYSPVLIKPSTCLDYPIKLKKRLKNDDDSIGQRSYSTSTKAESVNIQEQQTAKFNYDNHWSNETKKFQFSPPQFQALPNNLVQTEEGFQTISTPAMRKQRIDEENRKGSGNYKMSYSDLVKMKLKDRGDKMELVMVPQQPKVATNSGTLVQQGVKVNSMLEVEPNDIGMRRSITTLTENNNIEEDRETVLAESARRSYSRKSVKKQPKSSSNRKYNPECQTICTPLTKELHRSNPQRRPFEPESCQEPDTSKVYLPSKVRLPVVPCTGRPNYDCKPKAECADRADECMEIMPKKLPKLPDGPCPCIDIPMPSVKPKLKRLKFKFEDPTRELCHIPPCQIPRADDGNPPQFKPLKPHVPTVCDCVQPPPLVEVKLKRLPRCEPDEVCRPVRVCPIPEPCPPRADECYKIVPKKMPSLMGGPCPCIDPFQPAIAPRLKRLDLHVQDPERQCPPKPICSEAVRADDHMKPKKKKLRKIQLGDCPCEDRPMTDWNLKRLVCEDEPEDCVVPDPCQAFPRADWGCWEYSEEVCNVVDEKCVEKNMKCVPKPKEKPCRKQSICVNKGGGPLEYSKQTRRKFSNSSSTSSLKIYQQMRPRRHHPSETRQLRTKFRSASPRHPAGTIELIKMLNTVDKLESNNLLFEDTEDDKLDYNRILKAIASTSAEYKDKNLITNHAWRSKDSTPLHVSARAICTNNLKDTINTEEQMKSLKHTKAKQKCKNIRPTTKSLMCRKVCPKVIGCKTCKEKKVDRPGCAVERMPVCCEKEEPPYSSFSDNIERIVQPYVETTQWICNRPQYGFHPVNKKKASTSTDDNIKLMKPVSYKPQSRPLSVGYRQRSKDINYQQTHQFTTKVFRIVHPPVCKKVTPSECSRDHAEAPKIVCVTEIGCPEPSARKCNVKEFVQQKKDRVPPPFPAFSDCLDETMENVLSECPLDKERYLRIQPKHLPHPPKLIPIGQTVPVQGKLDLRKEYECMRKKHGIEKGITQHCEEFGDPIKIPVDGKQPINKDCQRIEELRAMGRWPPKRFAPINSRQYHTLRQLNQNNLQKNFQKLRYSTCKKKKRSWFIRRHSSSYKKGCPKFTLNNCPKKVKRRCRREPVGKDCSKPYSPYPAFSECKDYDIVTPICECEIDMDKMPDLQPRYSHMKEQTLIVKEYPDQPKIDRTIGNEYRKCKNGTPNEGQTFQCEDFEYFNPKKRRFDGALAEVKVQEHKIDDDSLSCCSQLAEECKPFNQLPEEESLPVKKLFRRECKEVVKSPCGKPTPSALELLWQNIVNYFKARPNCPEPGDYKKKSLQDRAFKAAEAAGLVAVDPKCLPQDLVKNLKQKPNCKQCGKNNTRSGSPQTTSRNFSTSLNHQSQRNYSSTKNCIEEINRILEKEEEQIDKPMKQYSAGKRTDTEMRAIKMSLDKHLNNYVDMRTLCHGEKRTYFGYTNIMPSRENMLERAWRVSIEAYTKSNATKMIFNDFFTRVENSINSAEELEKRKTENLIRELDQLLNTSHSNSKKKK